MSEEPRWRCAVGPLLGQRATAASSDRGTSAVSASPRPLVAGLDEMALEAREAENPRRPSFWAGEASAGLAVPSWVFTKEASAVNGFYTRTRPEPNCSVSKPTPIFVTLCYFVLHVGILLRCALARAREIVAEQYVVLSAHQGRRMMTHHCVL